MPIVYDKKTKTWQLAIKTPEEAAAVFEIGKRAIVTGLTVEHTSRMFNAWLTDKDLPMFNA
jgi:hypothetical protein